MVGVLKRAGPPCGQCPQEWPRSEEPTGRCVLAPPQDPELQPAALRPRARLQRAAVPPRAVSTRGPSTALGGSRRCWALPSSLARPAPYTPPHPAPFAQWGGGSTHLGVAHSRSQDCGMLSQSLTPLSLDFLGCKRRSIAPPLRLRSARYVTRLGVRMRLPFGRCYVTGVPCHWRAMLTL